MLPYVLLASLLLLSGAFGTLKVRHRARRQRRVRVLTRLLTVPCRNCGQAYGANVQEHFTVVQYSWERAPGNDASRLRLPTETFCVQCPHCSNEVELTAEGQPFQQPQTGVLGFTRTGILRSHGSIPAIAPL